MENSSKKSKTWSVINRLKFIDFTLYWEGQINRKVIMDKFNISIPQASKDLASYKELAPENLDYGLSEKKYFASPVFRPVFFEPDADAYLGQMRDDVLSITMLDYSNPNLPAHDVIRTPRRHVDPIILKKIVAAVNRNESCEMLYQSMSSGEPEARIVSPHALVFDGMRWHARGFCHKRKVHRDFLLARILDCKPSEVIAPSIETDTEWNTMVTVSLIPHPQLSKKQAEAVARDFSMNEGRLDVQIRQAFVYYFLYRLNLSDYDGRSNEPNKQHVVVENPEALRYAHDNKKYPL
jgi:hypothetical protein